MLFYISHSIILRIIISISYLSDKLAGGGPGWLDDNTFSVKFQDVRVMLLVSAPSLPLKICTDGGNGISSVRI